MEGQKKKNFFSQNEGVHSERRGRVKRKKPEESKFAIYTKNMTVEISHWLILAGISPYKRAGFFGGVGKGFFKKFFF